MDTIITIKKKILWRVQQKISGLVYCPRNIFGLAQVLNKHFPYWVACKAAALSRSSFIYLYTSSSVIPQTIPCLTRNLIRAVVVITNRILWWRVVKHWSSCIDKTVDKREPNKLILFSSTGEESTKHGLVMVFYH